MKRRADGEVGLVYFTASDGIEFSNFDMQGGIEAVGPPMGWTRLCGCVAEDGERLRSCVRVEMAEYQGRAFRVGDLIYGEKMMQKNGRTNDKRRKTVICAESCWWGLGESWQRPSPAWRSRYNMQLKHKRRQTRPKKK